MAKARVLIADDSPTSLAVVSAALEGDGYEVLTARDGLGALDAIYSAVPDVVLLDVVMPRMNGYQVCRMLKMDEHTRHIPVVMLTSRDQPVDQYRGLQTGADSYVTKEQPLQMVLEAIAAAVERRRNSGAGVRLASTAMPPSVVDLLSRLNDVLDRKLYEATILGEMSKVAWSADDPDRTAGEVMSLFGRLFDFHLACMLLLDGRSGAAELLQMVRLPVSGAALSDSEERVLSILEQRGGVRMEHRTLRRRTVVAPGVSVGAEGGDGRLPTSCHTVPLGIRDYEAGVFVLWASERVLASQESLQIIGMLANTASVVLDNARLYQEMRRLATTDGLTGVANHRHFQESLETEFQRSRRSGQPLSLLMLDLDHFKWVNDAFGHKRGDEVLHAVAAALMGSARKYDVVARYGGEEFAVVLPGTGARGAMEMGERLRLLVRTVAGRLKIDRLSTSVGVAVYPNSRIVDAQGMVREADAALYRAKAEGRNRVCIAPQG